MAPVTRADPHAGADAGVDLGPLRRAVPRGTGRPTGLPQREGHSRVLDGHAEAGFPLGDWVRTRRQDHKHGRLSLPRVTALESLPGGPGDARKTALRKGSACCGTLSGAKGTPACRTVSRSQVLPWAPGFARGAGSTGSPASRQGGYACWSPWRAGDGITGMGSSPRGFAAPSSSRDGKGFPLQPAAMAASYRLCRSTRSILSREGERERWPPRLSLVLTPAAGCPSRTRCAHESKRVLRHWELSRA